MSRKSNAVVTGASSGIGKAIAIRLAAFGGSICLVGRNADRLETVANTVRVSGGSALVFRADLSVDGSIGPLVRYIRRHFQSLDTLVHCAADYAVGDIETMSVDQFDALYRINVRVPYILSQALLPLLKLRNGQIVFLNSSQGLQARANTSAYASTKHALKAIADSLRQEINIDGVRVTSIFPGRTATPMTKALYEIEGRSYRPELLLQPEDVAEVVINVLHLPRTAEVTNIEIRPSIPSY
jgi:NADP-dependent 3-hydroxy acid dehydrogenase YdfG